MKAKVDEKCGAAKKDLRVGAGKIVVRILTALIAVAATCLLVVSVVAKIQYKPVYVFDYTLNVVVTDSMEPEIMVGDFVLAKRVDIDTLKVGDNIIFQHGKIRIIHSVYEIETDESGKRIITTKGINVDRPDVLKVTEETLVGIQVGQPSAFLGRIFSILKSPYTWICVSVLIVLSWIIVKLCKNISRLKKEAAQSGESGKE